MTAYILVKALDGWNKDDPMQYHSGYPVEVRETDQLGAKETPPKFVRVIVTDAEPAEVQTYCDLWERLIDWEFVAHDYSADAHRLRAFVKPELVSASGMNSLTRDMVEAFLSDWGAAITSVAFNSVTFDVRVYDALKSVGFWRRPVSNIALSELAYDQSTGVHRIQADFSMDSELTALSDSKRNRYIEERGGTVVNYALKNAVLFDISRNAFFEAFKQEVKKRADAPFSRRKWRFQRAAVEAALAAGGDLYLTRRQALDYLHDRLRD